MSYITDHISNHIVNKSKEKLKRNVYFSAKDYLDKTQSAAAKVARSTANWKLVIEQKGFMARRQYEVKNTSDQLLCTVHLSKGMSGISGAKLVDLHGQTVGSVRWDKDWLHVAGEKNKYCVSIGVEQLGTFIEEISPNIILNADFNGWSLVGTFTQQSFTIYNTSGEEMAKISGTLDSLVANDQYYIEMDSRANETISLLFFMTILVIMGNA